MKQCTKCGQTKPLGEFVKASKRPNGVSSHCKACHNAIYYQKHPRPKLRQLGPGDIKQCSKCSETKPIEQFDKVPDGDGYRSRCKVCRRSVSRAWKRRNGNRIKVYQKEWREAHPRYGKRWWAKMPETTREQYRKHKRRQSKTDYGRTYNVHRQHLRRTAERNGDVTPEWMQQLHKEQTKCAYCGRSFCAELPATIDHVYPLSKGGTHTKDNIVLACQPCNSTKNDRIIDGAYTSGLSDLPLLGCLEELQ